MMDWQEIVREATRGAASAKRRDYALTRLPEVSGWKIGSRDFASPDVRRLSGSLHDIRERVDHVLSSLDAMQGEEAWRDATLEEIRLAGATNGDVIGYHLDMIERDVGAFRRR